jgi:hypothetical protein
MVMKRIKAGMCGFMMEIGACSVLSCIAIKADRLTNSR